MSANLGLGTTLVHGDDAFSDINVAPPISVTTTFRADDVELNENSWDPSNPKPHVYSRYTQNVSTRVEKILGALHNAHALTYASGLSAAYSALVHLKPKRIAIGKAYHGVHKSIEVYEEARYAPIPRLDLDDEYRQGDIVWLETPINPTGEALDIQHYADKIHAVGGKLIVDATFAPPPLQNPLLWGADVVMHSATKYFGGHSDLLAGVLVVPSLEEWKELFHRRTYVGNVMGSLESWLLLRSLRTLHLRVARQSQTATALATWLNQFTNIPEGETLEGIPGGLVTRVHHSSLQEKSKFDPATQLTGGPSPTFALVLSSAAQAKAVTRHVQHWVSATSLGGVESLIEWRKRSDPGADPRLLRLSVGVEDFEDLKNDLKNALISVKDRSKADCSHNLLARYASQHVN